jgi:hypothetical protein
MSLLSEAQSWIGTPYRLGGLRQVQGASDWASRLRKFGMDCSEFTALVFQRATGVKLPWNAQEQYDATQRVSTPEPGDLVFFRGTDPTNTQPITHVGLYVGNGNMIDAENAGVKQSDITSGYWRDHLAGFGRVPAAGLAAGNAVGDSGMVPFAGGAGLPQVPPELSDPQWWGRIGYGIAGIGLVVVGVVAVAWPVVKPALRDAAAVAVAA